MKRCKLCETEVEDTATECPECHFKFGPPPKPEPFKLTDLIKSVAMIIGVALVIFGIIIGIIWLCGGFHEHDMHSVVAKAATCTEDGVEEYRCAECDHVEYTSKIYSGHKMRKLSVIKEPTCTEEGSAVYKCNVCGVTEEWTESSLHKYLTGTCEVCGAKKSNITANMWYTVAGNNVIQFQNAEIDGTPPISGGKAFMITYYPVCSGCQVCGPMDMVGVSANSPVTQAYICKSCQTLTYANFKVEY